MNDNDQALTAANASTPDTAPASAAPEGPATTDIDGLSEFTWQGEKWTPDKWSQVYNDYKKLSEQSKSFADNEKYQKNFRTDLDAVLKDPEHLVEKFKKIYPKDYHEVLDLILERRQAQAQPQSARPSLPPEMKSQIDEMSQRLKFFEDRAYQSEVQNASAQIDKITTPLFEKFALANEDQVYSRAEQMVTSGQKMTASAWERLIRESHEQMSKKSDRVNGAKLKEQIEKGKRGADTGPGGSAPGVAPKKAQTISQATDEYIASLR
jgi:hypothetical protein